MYKNVLLTENEIRVLYKVLDHHFNRSFVDTNAEDMQNLQIIKIALGVSFPQIIQMNIVIGANYPQMKVK